MTCRSELTFSLRHIQITSIQYDNLYCRGVNSIGDKKDQPLDLLAFDYPNWMQIYDAIISICSKYYMHLCVFLIVLLLIYIKKYLTFLASIM